MRVFLLTAAVFLLPLPAFAVDCGDAGYLRWECNPALQRDHPTGGTDPGGTPLPVPVQAPVVEEPEEPDEDEEGEGGEGEE
jgi:hypothetical protein